jgi:hypothetical protein
MVEETTMWHYRRKEFQEEETVCAKALRQE